MGGQNKHKNRTQVKGKQDKFEKKFLTGANKIVSRAQVKKRRGNLNSYVPMYKLND